MSSVSASVNNKFSVRLALKVHRLKKMLKPMLRFINSKKSSRCVECSSSPSSKASSWPEDCDAENAANEALASRLQTDISSGPGGVLTAWMDGQWTLLAVAPGGRSVPLPVAFLASRDGGFLWAPLADGDLCSGSVVSAGQVAEEQVPTAGSR